MKFILQINENNEIFIERNFSPLVEEGIGILDRGVLYLESYEALYLIYKNRAYLYKGNSQLGFNEALPFLINIDQRCWEKFLTYNFFKDKGFLIKRGYGKNCDFLIYEKGKSKENNIAKYMIKILFEGKSMDIKDFDRILDFSRKMRKGLILALVDSNGDITAYEASKIKL